MAELSKEELIEFLKENLSLEENQRRCGQHEVETTISLKLGDEVISWIMIYHG